MEAIEGSIGELREGFIQLIVTKSEEKMNEQSEYLFQVETNSSKLYIFCIPKKELKAHELQFTFPYGMGFNHLEDCFYLCGGWSTEGKYYS